MLRTRPMQYLVVGRQSTHLWLEVLHGEDRGIRVSVPLRDTTYDAELQDRVLDLSEGDVETFILESEDGDRPKWTITAIVSTVESEGKHQG